MLKARTFITKRNSHGREIIISSAPSDLQFIVL
jgi:hypothetical protein